MKLKLFKSFVYYVMMTVKAKLIRYIEYNKIFDEMEKHIISDLIYIIVI